MFEQGFLRYNSSLALIDDVNNTEKFSENHSKKAMQEKDYNIDYIGMIGGSFKTHGMPKKKGILYPLIKFLFQDSFLVMKPDPLCQQTHLLCEPLFEMIKCNHNQRSEPCVHPQPFS